MPQSTINQIKQLLNQSEKLSVEQQNHLHMLVDELNNNLHSLPEEQKEEARQIALLTYSKLELLESTPARDISYQDLENTALKFEASHPKLTYTLQSICQMLANLGI
jgi:hypothetical protein